MSELFYIRNLFGFSVFAYRNVTEAADGKLLWHYKDDKVRQIEIGRYGIEISPVR